MADCIVHKAVELKKVKAKQRAILAAPGYLEANYIAQPKYDGCNLTIIIPEQGDITALSRTGEVVKSVDHIIMALSSLPDVRAGVYLGEAWAPDLKFAEISGLFRTQRTDESTCRLQFAVFDFIDLHSYEAGVTTDCYLRRIAGLPETLSRVKQGNAPVWLAGSFGKLAESFPGNTAQHVANKLVEAGGYDGLILRDPTGEWIKGDSGTSGEIIKIKPLLRVSCKVTSWLPGKGKHEGKIGTLIVEYKGNGQGAGTGLKDSERLVENFDRDWLDKIVEIEALGETEDGLLREPRLIGVRTDVTEAD